MSDGNYNRNLLPYKDYQSGVRAGRAQMKAQAMRAFENWYTERYPSASPATTQAAFRDFANYLH